MTTGFRNSSGTDLDSVFDPYVQGTKPAATGFRTSDGVDLNQRFAPLSFGSAAAVQGYRLSSGADVNTLWAAKGTATYNIPGLQGNTYSVYGIASAASGQPGASVNCALAFNNTGAYSLTANIVSSGGGSGIITGFPASGTWLPSGWSVADCQIQFAYVETVIEAAGASITNPAVSYQSLSTSRSFLMSAACAATSTNSHGSSLAMTLRIKQVSTGAVITTTFTVKCDAASGA